ncbi:hypothetical protein MNBD_GAMMA19-106 [hydrothermal vent metagenome]|uniref:Uncharacterized protein n=1 Tax=hydrothermal vent metagenome TaxID=652676 RepID=A0A3B1AQ93_9ZZZZ
MMNKQAFATGFSADIKYPVKIFTDQDESQPADAFPSSGFHLAGNFTWNIIWMIM